MPTPPDILAQQIQRLRLADADKQRLKDEVEKLDPQSLEELTQLIREHDKEAMQILDEKAREELAVKERLMGALPNESTESTEAEIDELQDYLIQIFSDGKKLADFLALANDVLIVKLADFFDQVFAEDPERQQAVRNFFKEVRLQKMALKKDADEQEKVLVQEAIETKKQHIQELDQVIEEVEEELDKAEKKHS